MLLQLQDLVTNYEEVKKLKSDNDLLREQLHNLAAKCDAESNSQSTALQQALEENKLLRQVRKY